MFVRRFVISGCGKRCYSDVMRHLIASLPIVAFWAIPSFADGPVIEDVDLRDGYIAVTLSHPDTGWDHYANVWRVFDADGNQLAERVLAHPHVTEQPFTRGTSFELPEGIREIHLHAWCTHDDVSKVFVLEIPGS